MRISRELKNRKGFIKMTNTRFGYLHYTMSAWECVDDIKKFYKEGAHLHAMKKASAIATETATYTFETELFPTWKEAKLILRKNGKVLKWN